MILALTFGFSLLVLEIGIGRKTKSSALRAFTMFHKKFAFVGYLATLVPIIILPYYCVIGGESDLKSSGVGLMFSTLPKVFADMPFGNVTPLGMDFLTFFDYISNSVLMPIVALCTCILFGWVIGTKDIEDEVTKNGESFTRRKIFRFMIRYAAPVCLVIILVFYSLAQFGIISY